MVTLYQILGIEENASKEIIKSAYTKRINHPALDDKKRNHVKMAAEILLNDEKRKKYDNDLSEYRAQELLKNVTVSEESKTESVDVTVEEKDAIDDLLDTMDEESEDESNEINSEEIVEEETKSKTSVYGDYIFDALNENKVRNENMSEEEKIKEELEDKRIEELRNIEDEVNRKEYEKIRKKQEALNKKEMKKAKQEYKERYQEAYVNELRKRGYNVKYPWTWKRVKKLLLSIIIVTLVLVILWQIPVVRQPFVDLYNENVIVKMLVDIVKSVFNAIFSVFKSK